MAFAFGLVSGVAAVTDTEDPVFVICVGVGPSVGEGAGLDLVDVDVDADVGLFFPLPLVFSPSALLSPDPAPLPDALAVEPNILSLASLYSSSRSSIVLGGVFVPLPFARDRCPGEAVERRRMVTPGVGRVWGVAIKAGRDDAFLLVSRQSSVPFATDTSQAFSVRRVKRMVEGLAKKMLERSIDRDIRCIPYLTIRDRSARIEPIIFITIADRTICRCRASSDRRAQLRKVRRLAPRNSRYPAFPLSAAR